MNIYLPLQNGRLYRVELSKNPLIPRLKIFVNIPGNNGAIKAVGYDNIHYSITDTTQVSFKVGQANNDFTLLRSIGKSKSKDTLQPDYVAVCYLLWRRP